MGDSFTSCSRVFPSGCNCSQTASVCVLHGVTNSASKPDRRSLGSSLHGVTGAARTLLQHRNPVGSQPTLGIPLLQPGLLQGCRWISAPPCPPWAAGAQLPPHGLLQGLQGNLSSRAWSSSCPSFCTALVSAGLLLSYPHS